MAKESSSDVTNEYFKYKKDEADGFAILFPSAPYQEWKLTHLREAAKLAFPSLEPAQQNAVIKCFERSSEGRRSYASRFRYAPRIYQAGHDFWMKLLQYIISLGCPAAAESSIESHKDSAISVNEASFVRFLEDIELCVTQAETLWRRVAEGILPLSTASTCTYSLHRRKRDD